MVELDEAEHSALPEFMYIFDEQHFEPKPTVLTSRIHRTSDGQIIIPVSVQGESPSFTMALLMGHKANQIYKQTACRFVLGQCPENDPKQQTYVWTGKQWATLI